MEHTITQYTEWPKGQEVSYQLIKTDKGLQATNVVPVNQREFSAAF